jgi:hypothetical protein
MCRVLSGRRTHRYRMRSNRVSLNCGECVQTSFTAVVWVIPTPLSAFPARVSVQCKSIRRFEQLVAVWFSASYHKGYVVSALTARRQLNRL